MDTTKSKVQRDNGCCSHAEDRIDQTARRSAGSFRNRQAESEEQREGQKYLQPFTPQYCSVPGPQGSGECDWTDGQPAGPDRTN